MLEWGVLGGVEGWEGKVGAVAGSDCLGAEAQPTLLTRLVTQAFGATGWQGVKP